MVVFFFFFSGLEPGSKVSQRERSQRSHSEDVEEQMTRAPFFKSCERELGWIFERSETGRSNWPRLGGKDRNLLQIRKLGFRKEKKKRKKMQGKKRGRRQGGLGGTGGGRQEAGGRGNGGGKLQAKDFSVFQWRARKKKKTFSFLFIFLLLLLLLLELRINGEESWR